MRGYNNKRKENIGYEYRTVNMTSGTRSDVNRFKKNVSFYCSGKYPSVLNGKKLVIFNAYVTYLIASTLVNEDT
jgi:hypothetical protein